MPPLLPVVGIDSYATRQLGRICMRQKISDEHAHGISV